MFPAEAMRVAEKLETSKMLTASEVAKLEAKIKVPVQPTEEETAPASKKRTRETRKK